MAVAYSRNIGIGILILQGKEKILILYSKPVARIGY